MSWADFFKGLAKEVGTELGKEGVRDIMLTVQEAAIKIRDKAEEIQKAAGTASEVRLRCIYCRKFFDEGHLEICEALYSCEGCGRRCLRGHPHVCPA